ncbi:GTPase IMAP family member 4-like isoform X2 [Arapaima gigas]
MEGCDCKVDSPCTATYPCGDRMHPEGTVTDLGLSFNSVSTAALTVLGYLLYRFSQGLPAVIRWPIRVICSLTGLTSLWSWVSRLLHALLTLQNLLKSLTKIWKIIISTITAVTKCVVALTSLPTSFSRPHQKGKFESTAQVIWNPWDYGLRVIVVGPMGVGRSLVLDTLLGYSSQSGGGTQRISTECVSWRTVVDGKQVTVVDTPDLLGTSLEVRDRAREALRSLQLATPGPHAFLLVMPIPAPGSRVDTDAVQTLKALLDQVGEGALSHLLPVLTETGSIKGSAVPSQLLERIPEELRAMLSLCCHSPVVLPSVPQDKKRVLESELLKRVEEMGTQGGFYFHELHRKEEHFREKLLEDMAAALEQKLGGKENWGGN